MTNYIWTGKGDAHSWGDVNNWELQSNQEPNGTAPGPSDFAEFLSGDDVLIGDGDVGGFGVDNYYGLGAVLSLESGVVDSGSFEGLGGGELKVIDSAQLDVVGANNGSDAFYTQSGASVLVSGAGSIISVQGLTYFGDSGSGATLQVLDGGVVTVKNNTGDPTKTTLAIGQGGGSTATVSGVNSKLSETGGVGLVGYDSTASLTISDGASASFSQANGDDAALVIGLTSGSATVTVTGASLTTTEGVVGVADGGGDKGTLDVLAGATASFTQTVANAPTLIVGDDDSTATVEVSGAGSTLTTTSGGVQVANHGATGTLEIDDDGAMSIDGAISFLVGASTDSTGKVIVSGPGSTLTADSDDTEIGVDGGNGALNILDDASATFTQTSPFVNTLDIGDDGATGSVEVSGKGSTLTTNAGAVQVGDNGGKGSLDVLAGGSASFTQTDDYAPTLVIGDDATGTVDVSGQGSKLTTTSGGVQIANHGATGTLDIDDHATMTITNTEASPPAVIVGAGDGSAGTILLDDDATLTSGAAVWLGVVGGAGSLTVQDGSTFTTPFALHVGDDMPSAAAASTFDLNSGASASTGDADFGVNAGAMGTGDIDGVTGGATPQTTWTVTGVLTVGDSGTGKLTVSDDALLQVQSSSADDDAAFIGRYGVGTLLVDDGGQFSLTGADAELDIGVFSGGNGTLTLDGVGSSLIYSNALTVGDAGTGAFNVDDGAIFALSNNIVVGAQSGSTGAITVAGGGSSLTAANITVGDDGVGAMTAKSGGSIDVTGALVIGDQPNTSTTNSSVTIADASSSLTVAGALTVADDAAAALTIAGDSKIDGVTTIGVYQPSQGQVTVSGATFTLDDELIVGAQGTGTFTVDDQGALAAADQSVVLGNGEGGQGALTVTGAKTTAATDDLTVGEFGTGALNVLAGAKLTTSGAAVLADIMVPGGDDTASVDGGGVWNVDDGLTIGNQGSASVSATNGGALAVLGDVMLGGGAGSSGQLAVNGFLQSASSSLSYSGSLVVGDDGVGTLKITDDGMVSATTGGLGEIDIGASSGGQGAVTVDGAGSSLAGDDLTVGGNPIQTGGAGMLTISNSGKVTVSTATVTGAGAVTLKGGSLNTDPLLIETGGNISGFGTLAGIVTNDGVITAKGGALEIKNQVGGDLVIDANATLHLDSTVTSDGYVNFEAGGGEILDLGDPSAFGARAIDDFVVGDKIDLLKFAYSGPATVTLGPTDTLSLSNSSGGTANLTFDSADIGDTFTIASDGQSGALVELEPPCYVRGTRILTERGEIAVEALEIGDLAITASGARRPIVWLGHRRIDLARHRNPLAVRPVRVSAGAFGEGAPRRDLWLSPGHNIVFEDVLTPISCMVNGRSIVQIERPSVEYWHVELETHDILLAEGFPAESYLDCGNRTAFANGGAFVEAHPDFGPKHWAETCLPLAKSGAPVARAKACALARLEARGEAVVEGADAHILADGLRIEPLRLSDRRLVFALPPGRRQITLMSRVFIPAHTTPESEDARELGLCVSRLQIDGETIAMESLGAGWRQPEFQDGRFQHRWTCGAASLPAGARLVIVDLAVFGRYWREPVAARRLPGGPRGPSARFGG